MIKGVNLGNWLVLEKWMSPVVFDGFEVEDETWLARTLDPKVLTERMKAHRETYITERDFVTIASHGLNTVRIPVPYFIFGDRPPFIGCINYLDKAFNWAEKYGLQILIDLHTVPGGQNGFDNGGICGVCKWCQSPEEVEFVLNLLERLSERYGKRKGLYGIEILNEPISEEAWKYTHLSYKPVDLKEAEGSGAVPSDFLRKFYTDAYHRIRKYMPVDKAVVFHDGFRIREWKNFMQNDEFENVVLDTHQYTMVFNAMNIEPTLENYRKAMEEVEELIVEMKEYFPVIVGEWCLFNPLVGGKIGAGGPGSGYGDQNEESALQSDEVSQIYNEIARMQLKAWSKSDGFFYWNYKILVDTTHNTNWIGWDSWDLNRCWDMGWFPDKV
jgi:aryl-phospho-beta-D-glucosidase BglC (GH1 family)